eukprot:5995560-Pyramimonas_sp.AAC.1
MGSYHRCREIPINVQPQLCRSLKGSFHSCADPYREHALSVWAPVGDRATAVWTPIGIPSQLGISV